MHNRARETTEQLQARKEANKPKVDKYGLLNKAVLANHAAQKYDAEALALSAKLLELNPEVYTAWNYRKQAVLATLPTLSHAEGAALLDGELKLTVKALQKNPKSYGSWHHRKGHADLEKELGLCGQFLDLDERNFHCWSYRRYVAQRAGRHLEDELAFTTHKIEQNFSNYSAWHYRTSLLPLLHQPAAAAATAAAAASPRRFHADLPPAPAPDHPGLPCVERPSLYCYDLVAEGAAAHALPASVLDAEFELVQQALFTEPADQSGWLYHRWLLGQAMHTEEAGVAEEVRRNTLAREVGMLRELLALEPNSKWCRLTLARCLEAQRGAHPAAEEGAAAAELSDLYSDLIALDPMRENYFRDSERKLA